MGRRRRRSCASPTPRRRRPTWPTACSRRLPDGRASDQALAKAIVDCGAAKPDPARLVFARQLFARAIETPGGLKIQTIHAFAEKLLRLFPFEANVPAHFKVLDETE